MSFRSPTKWPSQQFKPNNDNRTFIRSGDFTEKSSPEATRILKDQFWDFYMAMDQYLQDPISTIFRVMNIHLPAILRFTRGTRFWPIPIYSNWFYVILRFQSRNHDETKNCPKDFMVIPRWPFGPSQPSIPSTPPISPDAVPAPLMPAFSGCGVRRVGG